MIKTIKDPYCDRIKTKKLIKKFCDNEDLLFRDGQTYYFNFSIVKLITRINTGFIHTLINGKYIHKYICYGNIIEDNILRIRFQHNIDSKIIDSIIDYINNENINAEITYPCDE